ncbi:MAG: hypothetical protein IKC91_03115 [Clostridia bacterium]|nr:hypothetical protein [Clostridia bacterium]
MEKILISDAGENNARIAYIYNALCSHTPVRTVRPTIYVGQTRSAIFADEALLTPAFIHTFCKLLIESIAIGAKYAYLSARLPLDNLSKAERQIFLCALIAADLSEEKKYIRSKLSFENCRALDGFFSFRLHALKQKWNKTLSYIPPDFSPLECDRFLHYFISGNSGMVYVNDGLVYDSEYRICRRGQLVGEALLCPQTEILLSGAKEVNISQSISKELENFLRKYYAEHTVFYKK